MNKKIAFIVLIISLITMAGCGLFGPKLPPDESVKAIYDLYISGETSGVAKLGMKEEEIQNSLETYDKTLSSTLKSSFTAGGLHVEDSVIEEISEARKNVLKKISATFEITKEGEDFAEVLIKTSYFNETSLYETAAAKAQESADADGISDQNEYLEQITKYYTTNLIEGYYMVEPEHDTKEITVSCVKQNSIWLPGNMSEFGIDLGYAVSGQQ